MTAKILTFDIETSPAVVHSWGLGKNYLNLGQLVEEPRIICVAAKWYHQRTVQFLSEWGEGRQGMLQAVAALFDEADVLVGFNSRSFDTRWVRGELIREGIDPPSPAAEIDLYLESKQFRFVSHKLMHLSKMLTDDSKMESGGFDLWKRCLDGDTKAQARMKRYNVQDVRATEALYDVLKPWLKKPVPPSLLALDEDDCPRCEAKGMLQRRGKAVTTLGVFQRYQCQACHGWSRGKHAAGRVEQRAV